MGWKRESDASKANQTVATAGHLERTSADTRLAVLAKALGNPARVRILRYLLARQVCMCGEICDVLPLAQSTVSQHLKVLKDAGLIVGTVDGPRVCYSPSLAAVDELKHLMGDL